MCLPCFLQKYLDSFRCRFEPLWLLVSALRRNWVYILEPEATQGTAIWVQWQHWQNVITTYQPPENIFYNWVSIKLQEYRRNLLSKLLRLFCKLLIDVYNLKCYANFKQSFMLTWIFGLKSFMSALKESQWCKKNQTVKQLFIFPIIKEVEEELSF